MGTVPTLDQPGTKSVVTILNVFIARAKWALSIQEQAQALFERIEQSIVEIAVVKQGVEISLVHLRHHSAGLEKSFETSVDFALNLDRDATAGANWRETCNKLTRITIHPVLLSGHSEEKLLSNWIDREELEKVSKSFDSDRTKIRNVLRQLKTEVQAVIERGKRLEHDAGTWIKANTAPIYDDNVPAVDDSWQRYKDLAEDIGTLVRKIQGDCDYVATLSDIPSNIKNASRIMVLHEREFLPNVREIAEELWEITRTWVLSKTYAQRRMVSYLCQISQIQSQTSPLRLQLNENSKRLRSAEDQRVILARAIDMPYLYGALLLEFIRRYEWLGEVKATVSRSAEIMAGWVEDEIKLRTKWKRQYGGSLGMLKRIGGDGTSDIPEVEVSLVNSRDEKVFNLSRSDLEAYLKVLESLNLDEEYQELKRQLGQLSKVVPLTPLSNFSSSTQKKHMQLFKGGSVSEYSQTDFPFQRPKTLGDASETNEGVIQGYEARIRKLEDLLHRNQFRDTWTNKFQPPALSGVFKREAPINSADNEEIQNLKERVKSLEAEKEDSVKEISNLKEENEALKVEVEKNKSIYEEAQMMKSDLLANISAKEAEYNTERRLLLTEIAELKGKVDDLEIELERESDRSAGLETKLDTFQSQVDHNEKSRSSDREEFTAQKVELELQNSKLQAQFDLLYSRARDMSQRLYTSYKRSCDLLECLGLQSSKVLDDNGELTSFRIQRVKGLGRRSSARNSNAGITNSLGDLSHDTSGILDGGINVAQKELELDPNIFYWLDAYYNDIEEDDTPSELEYDEADRNSLNTNDSSLNNSAVLNSQERIQRQRRKLSTVRELRYRQFLGTIYLDYDLFRDSVTKRFNDVEHLARKLQKEARNYRERAHMNELQSRHKLAYKGFQKGELALFLPTRDQSRDPNPWAAFNVGAPHYFLKPSSEHQLENREWLVGRITKLEERVVDRAHDKEGDNPFDLSDGLRWHLIEAKEER